MTQAPERSLRSERFRSAIAAFIEDRRQAKLKGKDEDAGTASKYDYTAWLADAARRVGQIQAVTHVLKATHPDARGSSLHVAPDRLPERPEIGSHSLGQDFAEDVVGNAAALDVFKFLKLEVDGRRLLDWMQAGDADLAAALHEQAATARAWMAAFAGLVRSETTLSSHEAAKQVYWLVGDEPAEDDQFHLLQPMFSSSLAHAVHAQIQDARFGEANKAAREAFRARKPHDREYRSYSALVARKLGGTKPQNISQLNSERGGVNYLLASLPPKWTRESPGSLMRRGSALERFIHFDGVRELLNALAAFLRSNPARTADTRDRRDLIGEALGSQLAVFAASIQDRFAPGWTRDPDCELPQCERLWLDPERSELPQRVGNEAQAQADQDFIDAYHRGDWPDEVARRYANWLNQHLRDAGIVGLADAEYAHWARHALIEAAWPVPLRRRAGGRR